MFEVCLETLLSGIISVSGPQLIINENNNLYYTSANRIEYVIPDKYNQITLCQEPERFNTKTKKPFIMLKTIE